MEQAEQVLELGFFPDAFLAALPKLLYGMAGVFLVMLLIMLALYGLKALGKRSKKD